MFDRVMKQVKAGRKTEDESGFTLIELLVVIIILGILAAVVVFAVGGVGDKGQTASCKIDTRTIRTAQEAYAAQTVAQGGGGGNYATEAELVPNFLSELSDLHDIDGIVDNDPATTANEADFKIEIAAGAGTKCGGNTGSEVNGSTVF